MFNWLPHNYSDVLSGKRVERVKLSDAARNAERAMKTAMYARIFNSMDSKKEGLPGLIDGNVSSFATLSRACNTSNPNLFHSI